MPDTLRKEVLLKSLAQRFCLLFCGRSGIEMQRRVNNLDIQLIRLISRKIVIFRLVFHPDANYFRRIYGTEFLLDRFHSTDELVRKSSTLVTRRSEEHTSELQSLRHLV